MNIIDNTNRRNIMDRNFNKESAMREEVMRYAKYGVGRPDVALSLGSFRTEDEFRDYIKRGKEMRLPNPQTSRSIFDNILQYFRKYFTRI